MAMQQEPKLKVPTMYKAYVRPMYRDIPQNMAVYVYGTNVPPFSDPGILIESSSFQNLTKDPTDLMMTWFVRLWSYTVACYIILLPGLEIVRRSIKKSCVFGVCRGFVDSTTRRLAQILENGGFPRKIRRP